MSILQVGDGTNFVLLLAGALLEHAEDLLRMGLSPTEVVEGYEMAAEKALNILPSKPLISRVALRTITFEMMEKFSS